MLIANKKIMKKLIAFLFVACLSLAFASTSEAQSIVPSVDTITNSGTANLSFAPKGGEIGISAQVVITKISGTVAGNCVLQGSIIGSSWDNISTDTLTLTDVASQTKLWQIAPAIYPQVRCLCTGSGTMAAQIALWHFKR